jgi:hypothetical protein
MLWLCVEPERRVKCERVMLALYAGIPGDKRIVYGPPPDDGSPFVIWGQRWTTEDVLPKAIATGRPFWYIDNGFWNGALRAVPQFHRITYRSMTPVMLDNPPARNDVEMKPWRKDGRHVVLALPGEWFGRALGFNMPDWIAHAPDRVRRATSRMVLVRGKYNHRPIESDLRGAWALVTHSSNAAVDAVRYGIPVFVEPTSAAAPVGSLDLADLENPVMPDRTVWWRSLMHQQFTLGEMADGTAWRLMQMVKEQAR